MQDRPEKYQKQRKQRNRFCTLTGYCGSRDIYLKGRQPLGKGAYKADIVFDREDIGHPQLMRGCHYEVKKKWSCRCRGA